MASDRNTRTLDLRLGWIHSDSGQFLHKPTSSLRPSSLVELEHCYLSISIGDTDRIISICLAIDYTVAKRMIELILPFFAENI